MVSCFHGSYFDPDYFDTSTSRIISFPGNITVLYSIDVQGVICIKPAAADFPGTIHIAPFALWDVSGTVSIHVGFKRIDELDVPGVVTVTTQPALYIPGVLLVGTEYLTTLKLNGKILYDPMDEPDEPGMGIMIGISVGGTSV